MNQADFSNKQNSLIIKDRILIKAFNLDAMVNIPYGVVELGYACLYNQVNMEHVIMASSVIKIGNGAFEGCDNLRMIKLSPNIEYIGRSAFADCFFLRSLVLPVALKEIDFGAFNGCRLLAEITIYNNLEIIQNAAFIHTRISKVNYMGTIHNWLKITFSNHMSNPLCRNANLFIGEELVKDLVIPEDVEVIGKNTFYGCKSIRTLVIKDGVKEIGASAFARCSSLKKAYIPRTVKKIGRGVFAGCNGLTIKLSEELFERIKNKRCPVCQNKLPFFENACKICGTVFEPYE